MLAIARAMATPCASISGALTRLSGTGKKFSASDPFTAGCSMEAVHTLAARRGDGEAGQKSRAARETCASVRERLFNVGKHATPREIVSVLMLVDVNNICDLLQPSGESAVWRQGCAALWRHSCWPGEDRAADWCQQSAHRRPCAQRGAHCGDQQRRRVCPRPCPAGGKLGSVTQLNRTVVQHAAS